MKKLILNPKVNVKKLISGDKHYFFGYYDKSPWSKDEKYVIALEVDFIDRHPKKEDSANIILIDIKNNKKEKIAETKVWNWQQGCMLQWLGPDFNSKIIFNDLRKRKFVSIIKDIRTKNEKLIDSPVYAVCPDGKKALSLNFSRLNNVRKGYGYPGKEDKYKNEIAPKKDGIYLVNLEKNKSNLIISLRDLYNYRYIVSMNKGKHWVDHIGISPNGKRFCFFHRWNIEGNLFHTRLFTADLNGKNLFMFPDSGFYSHIFWKNNKDLFGYGSISEKFGNIRKDVKKSKLLLKKILPIYRKLIPKSIRKRVLPISYYILKDKTKRAIKLPINNEDGHSTWFNDKYLITDTYPDKRHYRTLIYYDLELKKKIKLGKFYTLPDKKNIRGEKLRNYDTSSIRCDLHPRWDRKGEKVCFDSVHEGYRNMYEVYIKNLFD